MRTTVVTGVLGSGKTTFIRNFLKESEEKAVVLVNDFGQEGIDGEIFSASGIEAVELPSGCVCCTLRFDLITTVQRIMRLFAPDHLLIEPSGVASPSAVLEALESAGIGAATVIGIVDAVEFAELYESGMYGSFFRDQIENSDVIMVNKTDLASADAVTAAEGLISSINPRAVLLRTVNAKMSPPLPDSSGHRTISAGDCRYHFDTVSYRISTRPSFASFTSFFAALARGRFGSVVRAKALVNTVEGPYRFDIAYGRVDTVPFEKDVAGSRLVVIGEEMDRAAIEKALGLPGLRPN